MGRWVRRVGGELRPGGDVVEGDPGPAGDGEHLRDHGSNASSNRSRFQAADRSNSIIRRERADKAGLLTAVTPPIAVPHHDATPPITLVDTSTTVPDQGARPLR
jgi:hypothetical protein